MSTFPAATLPLSVLATPQPLGDGRFSISFPDTWQQGRGLFGGLVVAALIRAAERHLATADRPVRSVTAELCGPVQPGPAELRVETLRAGTGVATVAVRLLQGAEVQAHAVVVLGRQRVTALDRRDVTAPTQTPWRELELLPVVPPLAPVFAQHWSFRSSGPFPMSGHGTAEAAGWIQPTHDDGLHDAAWLAACADAWWPALFATTAEMRPMATVAFTLQVVGDTAGLDPKAPLLYAARDLVVRDGYATELRELWGEDGRLLALNQQTFVIIK